MFPVDPDYLQFLDLLKNSEPETIQLPETFLEEIEAREKELKGCFNINNICHKVLCIVYYYLIFCWLLLHTLPLPRLKIHMFFLSIRLNLLNSFQLNPLVELVCTWDGTGCEFKSWHVNIISHVHRAYDYSSPFGVLWVHSLALYKNSRIFIRLSLSKLASHPGIWID